MKKAVKKLKLGLLIVLSICMLVPPQAGIAASKKQNALKAYEKWLTKSTVYIIPKGKKYWNTDSNSEYCEPYKGIKSSRVKFAIIYLDNDNIPEMVVYDRKNCWALFTYRGGKVVRLDYDAVGHVAIQYHRKVGVYKKDQVFLPMYEIEVVAKKSGKYKTIFEKTYNSLTNVNPLHYFNRIKNKELTAKQYTAGVKKLTKGVKQTKIVYRANTKQNRKKYLK